MVPAAPVGAPRSAHPCHQYHSQLPAGAPYSLLPPLPPPVDGLCTPTTASGSTCCSRRLLKAFHIFGWNFSPLLHTWAARNWPCVCISMTALLPSFPFVPGYPLSLFHLPPLSLSLPLPLGRTLCFYIVYYVHFLSVSLCLSFSFQVNKVSFNMTSYKTPVLKEDWLSSSLQKLPSGFCLQRTSQQFWQFTEGFLGMPLKESEGLVSETIIYAPLWQFCQIIHLNPHIQLVLNFW